MRGVHSQDRTEKHTPAASGPADFLNLLVVSREEGNIMPTLHTPLIPPYSTPVSEAVPALLDAGWQAEHQGSRGGCRVEGSEWLAGKVGMELGYNRYIGFRV